MKTPNVDILRIFQDIFFCFLHIQLMIAYQLTEYIEMLFYK